MASSLKLSELPFDGLFERTSCVARRFRCATASLFFAFLVFFLSICVFFLCYVLGQPQPALVACVRFLQGALHSTSTSARLEALSIPPLLSAVQDPLLPHVIGRVRDTNPEVRAAAIGVLARMVSEPNGNVNYDFFFFFFLGFLTRVLLICHFVALSPIACH